ncbi:hypothetical protein [Nocardia sp. NPDC058497]|uniref:hypothetical protein n=1 Tax=Nocardia sp. NPDC058497 TaxID=3346529 RepID=UPI003668E9D0
MASVRAIDTCALIPRATLDGIGTIMTVEASAPDTCAAELDSTEIGKKTRLTWSLSTSRDPLGPSSGTTETKIGDATVHTERDAQPAPDSKIRTCTAWTRFPATVGLFVHVSAPIAAQPCAAHDAALPGALELLRTEPPVGTSPDTPKTPVAVANPCAVLTQLDISTPLDKQFLHGCMFEYKGTIVDLQYAYDNTALVARGKPILVVNDHPGYDLGSTTETAWYAAILGDPLTPAGPTNSALGPRVPVVNLMGRDPAVLREVLGHTAELFPSA